MSIDSETGGFHWMDQITVAWKSKYFGCQNLVSSPLLVLSSAGWFQWKWVSLVRLPLMPPTLGHELNAFNSGCPPATHSAYCPYTSPEMARTYALMAINSDAETGRSALESRPLITCKRDGFIREFDAANLLPLVDPVPSEPRPWAWEENWRPKRRSKRYMSDDS